MKIKIKLTKDGAIVPCRATDGAAAYDVYVPKDTIVYPGRQVVPLGFAMELPQGYCAEIHPRSGYASKGVEGYRCILSENGSVIAVKNTPTRYEADIIYGLIDEDYRGEVGAIINNIESVGFALAAGTRIAQMVIRKVEPTEFETVEELSTTSRGDGGFGSTNK
jgi:dUTP pyrophosphatase